MAKLTDLLSENSDREKVLSTLKKISGRKKDPSCPPVLLSEKTQRIVSTFDPRIIEFAAIDVETTGLDYKSDRVIEIGAVKFIGDKVEGEFSSIVNPGMSLPDPIIRLTGITNSEVASAPSFGDVANAFLEFIGHRPLCGHQIDFDISFLNEEFKRIGKSKLTSLEIDTALLSRMIVPSIERYSLKHVAAILGISLKNAHRALSDAMASGQVACSLFSQLDTLPINMRLAMAHFAPASFLKTLLFKSIGGTVPETERSMCVGAVKKPIKKILQNSSLSEISFEKMQNIFSVHGSLSDLMKGFIERPSQTRMARCVAEAFNTKTFLVAEAGTGTGKSLAYLIPAALYAIKNNTRILVSTHTRNLQDQLMSKDLPIAKKIAGNDFHYCVLKGRTNYLCIRRYLLLLSGDLIDLSYRERMGVLPLIRWAAETKTGDIEEQNQFNIKWFSRIWRMICADAHLCEGKQCNHFSHCFLQNARIRALGSHIVVINHALFYSDICSESSFLGSLGSCIFDEAHHLESCGHRHLRVEVDTNRFMQFVDSITSIEKEMRKNEVHENAKFSQQSLKPIVKRLRSEIRGFLTAVDAWVTNQHPSSIEFQLGYDKESLAPIGSYTALISVFSELQDILNHPLQSFEYKEKMKNVDTIRPHVNLLLDKTSQLKSDLMYVVEAITEDHVFWIEGNRKKGWVKLCGVPLDIGSILSRLWEQTTQTCIFTSATLSVAHSMDYFKQKIGLVGACETKTRCESFESPFHPGQTERCAMSSSPDPDAPEFPAYTADIISSLMAAFQKNILVLFTSNAMLEAVFLCLRQLPFQAGCTLLAQGITGSRQTILDEFKNSRPCVLLGADSFWEGIDVPGNTCEIVIITRLPFQMPTHPLTKAIAEKIKQQAGESFFAFSVPEAVIKFRQGTGRLIRDQKDRGALIVLDNRILTKNYGKRFCESLDGELQPFSSVEALMRGLKSFFSGENNQEPSPRRYVPIEEV